MGMIDRNVRYSAAQAVTALGDTVSTHAYDRGDAIGGDVNITEELTLNSVVQTPCVGAGASVQFVLQDSADNVTFADVLLGPVRAVAALTQGAGLYVGSYPLNMRRYTRVVYRVTGAVLTAGKFDSYASNTRVSSQARTSGFTVM